MSGGGLKYGWWKEPDIWAFIITLAILVFFGVALIGAWWLV